MEEFGSRVSIVRSNYVDFQAVLDRLSIKEWMESCWIWCVVIQLDEAKRGFTYREDAPLDMRMDQRQNKTAKDIVNGYSEQELYRMIRDYGEDRFAKNIAKHIVAARKEKEIETTGELVEIIKAAIPMRVRAAKGHPAKQTFQAIRIELNRELDVLRESLDGMIERLNPNGRLCIITFHSLEDRIVKNSFRKNENPVSVLLIFQCVSAAEYPREP